LVTLAVNNKPEVPKGIRGPKSDQKEGGEPEVINKDNDGTPA
jgi:hypothetical protein